MSEIILYSHFTLSDPALLSSFSLLHDRVILPLADWAAGPADFAKRMRDNCEAISDLIDRTEKLRRGKRPLLKPLTIEDALIAGSGDSFGVMFNSFLEENGINWRHLTTESPNLKDAFATMHAFITSELVRENRRPDRQLVCWSGESEGPSDVLYQKIATVLEIELERFRMPNVVVDPECIDGLRQCLNNCDSRSTFRMHLRDYSKTIEAKINQAKSTKEKRSILLDGLLTLKSEYERWLNKLRTLESLGMIRIKNDDGNNLLFLAGRFIRFKIAVAGGLKYMPFCKLYGSAQYEQLADKLFGIKDIGEYVGQVTWQKHLFFVETTLKE